MQFANNNFIFCQAISYSAISLSLEFTPLSHNYQPYHLIYWLCNDYIYFKFSCV